MEDSGVGLSKVACSDEERVRFILLSILLGLACCRCPEFRQAISSIGLSFVRLVLFGSEVQGDL